MKAVEGFVGRNAARGEVRGDVVGGTGLQE